MKGIGLLLVALFLAAAEPDGETLVATYHLSTDELYVIPTTVRATDSFSHLVPMWGTFHTKGTLEIREHRSGRLEAKFDFGAAGNLFFLWGCSDEVVYDLSGRREGDDLVLFQEGRALILSGNFSRGGRVRVRIPEPVRFPAQGDHGPCFWTFHSHDLRVK